MEVPILLPKIFNHPFTYFNSSENIKDLNQGDIVIVPFGKKKEIGVVWDKIKNLRQQYLCFHVLIVLEIFLIKNELVFYQQLMRPLLLLPCELDVHGKF